MSKVDLIVNLLTTQPPKLNVCIFSLKISAIFFVIKINKTKHQRKTGDARRLEDAARKASSTFPVVLSGLNSVTATDVNKEMQDLQSVLGMDIKILEGIALAMILARMV